MERHGQSRRQKGERHLCFVFVVSIDGPIESKVGRRGRGLVGGRRGTFGREEKRKKNQTKKKKETDDERRDKKAKANDDEGTGVARTEGANQRRP